MLTRQLEEKLILKYILSVKVYSKTVPRSPETSRLPQCKDALKKVNMKEKKALGKMLSPVEYKDGN